MKPKLSWIGDKEVIQENLCAVHLVLVAWNELRQGLAIEELSSGELVRWAKAIGPTWRISEFFGALKQADDLTLRILAEGKILSTSYGRFKRDLEHAGGKMCQLMLCIPLVKSVLSSSGDDAHIWALHQAFYFGKKYRCFNSDRSNAAVEHFLAVDQGLGKFADPEPLKRFFTRHLSELTPPEPWMFHHSNGRTAEVPRNAPAFLKDLFLGRDDLVEWGISQGLVPGDLLPRRPFRRVSKLIPVPKDAMKDRTIAAEPTTCQWLQQGFATRLWGFIANHDYLSTRIDQIRNGAENACLAKIGSIRGDIATLDESDASDTFYWPLALAVTEGCSVLQAMLIVSRSGEVELPNGDIVPLRKLSGMGSALTFPMESLLFCAIIEYAIELCGGSVWSSRYHVHGDDICVETQYATMVMDLLEAYGFKPNREKSFFQRRLIWNFRESCGGEYLDGVELSLVRIPRTFHGWTESVLNTNKAWPSEIVDLANASFSILPAVRAVCVQRLQAACPKGMQPVFSFDGTLGFKSYAPTNYHLRRRRNVDLQYVEYEHGTWRLANDRESRSKSTLCYRNPELPKSLGTTADYIMSYWLTEWLRRAEAREIQILDDARRSIVPIYEAIRVEALEPQRSLWGKTWSVDPWGTTSPSKP